MSKGFGWPKCLGIPCLKNQNAKVHLSQCQSPGEVKSEPEEGHYFGQIKHVQNVRLPMAVIIHNSSVDTEALS